MEGAGVFPSMVDLLGWTPLMSRQARPGHGSIRSMIGFSSHLDTSHEQPHAVSSGTKSLGCCGATDMFGEPCPVGNFDACCNSLCTVQAENHSSIDCVLKSELNGRWRNPIRKGHTKKIDCDENRGH